MANLTLTEDSSAVEVYVKGLTPNTQYASHVHNGLCSDGGGSHYLQDASGEDVAFNGLRPTLTTDANGMAIGMATPFAVTEQGKSVVIHEPETGTRIACADLTASAGMAGSFSATTVGIQMDPELMGHGYVSVNSNNRSKAEITVMGFTAVDAYPAHIHVGECETGGGAHYLQDISGMDISSNGLWPMAHTDMAGNGFGSANNPFMVPKSAVIHQLGTGERIACANLNMPLLAYRSGQFLATADGMALYGDAAITGNAMLSIMLDGTSCVKLMVNGLKADAQYVSHVHNGNCESGDEGHYLQMMMGEDSTENSLWPGFLTNSTGMGSASQRFVVRNNARSVVIHEPGASTRIACAGLK